MSGILDAIDKLAKNKYTPEWSNPHVRKYVEAGDPADLAKIPQFRSPYFSKDSLPLPHPDAWTDEATRVLQIAKANQLTSYFESWLLQYAHFGQQPAWHHLKPAIEILRSIGVSDVEIRGFVLRCKLWDHEKNEPTPAGVYYLEASDSEIAEVLKKASYRERELVPLIARSNPDRMKRYLQEGVYFGYLSSLELHTALVKANPRAFADKAYELFQQPGDIFKRLTLIWALGEALPKRFLDIALHQSREFLKSPTLEQDGITRLCLGFLLEHRAPDALQLACSWMSEGTGRSYQRGAILKWAAENAPEHLLEMAKACARCSSCAETVLLGLEYWRERGIDSEELYHDAIRRALENGKSDELIPAIQVARDWSLTRTAEDLWPLMEHKSRPVRSAAARVLAGLGYSKAGERALQLLAHKKAEVRQSAVLLLSQMEGNQAIRDLKLRLDLESNDDVRDTILLALERSGAGASFTPEERRARIAKTVSKAKGPPADWIALDKIQLFRLDGSALTADETLYLLIRQSRCKEMRPDLEAKWLFEQLDRPKCAAASLSLLQAFLASKQDAADRWVLAFAALTGDDRLVPALRKSIIDWADGMRGKLAEYGAQALALLGTEAALMVLDSLSVRYRSKNKNIGQAATEAFAAAAEARGVSVEELGDLVVPWLGFEPNQPRLITGSKAEVEARIGSDLKLTFRDKKTGKLAPKLPAGVSAELQAEFKVLAATLKEAVKAQLLRIETLLVRQFRWPVGRWRELYLAHPLLLPFAQGLVWGWRDDRGELKVTFRALEDASLTDMQDNSVELPNGGTVSLVHPLDLDEESRLAWATHLADYQIAPPFLQLERPVVRVKSDETQMKYGKLVEGTELNALTFRSRAEKLGWVRGSVGDGASVWGYRKVFSGSEVEAYLRLDGMFIGVGMSDTVTLQQFCFVRSGTVKVGNYCYDEPGEEKDPRLIPFGEVPAVPYSEVIGDLLRISGQETAEPAGS